MRSVQRIESNRLYEAHRHIDDLDQLINKQSFQPEPALKESPALNQEKLMINLKSIILPPLSKPKQKSDEVTQPESRKVSVDLQREIVEQDDKELSEQTKPQAEDSSYEPRLAQKRQAKNQSKRRQRKQQNTVEENDQKPFNAEIIEEAVKKFERKDANKPRRGRKPVREDKYIQESLEKIAAMEKRLEDEAESLTDKEKESLRNTASALRSRLNRKLEKKSLQMDLQNAQDQFSVLAEILMDEITSVKARERVSEKMKKAQMQKASNKSGEKRTLKSAMSKAPTRQELMNRMKEFIGFNSS